MVSTAWLAVARPQQRARQLDMFFLLVASALGVACIAMGRFRRDELGLPGAMLVATGSLFLGQPQVFAGGPPEPAALRAIPVLLVLLAMIYWRIRLSRRPPTLARTGG